MASLPVDRMPLRWDWPVWIAVVGGVCRSEMRCNMRTCAPVCNLSSCEPRRFLLYPLLSASTSLCAFALHPAHSHCSSSSSFVFFALLSDAVQPKALHYTRRWPNKYPLSAYLNRHPSSLILHCSFSVFHPEADVFNTLSSHRFGFRFSDVCRRRGIHFLQNYVLLL